jgi:hypothetical protein
MYQTHASTSLDNSALARLAPAIFAEAAHDSTSERYTFVPTIKVIDALRSGGWSPFAAMQGKARDKSRVGVQQHIVRLRHPDMIRAGVDGVIPELVLKNSHDGSTSYQLHAGVFRMVCSNGMIVADTTFEKVSIRHANCNPSDILDASFEVIEDVPAVMESVETMRALPLSTDEQRAFAGVAASLRWEDDATPIDPVQLLTTRRREDRQPDLWSTLNVVQENLVRGGLRGRNTSGKRQRTRGIDSVTEDTRINKAIWRLADEMRRIKGAA